MRHTNKTKERESVLKQQANQNTKHKGGFMMKKLVFALLALMITVSLTACPSPTPPGDFSLTLSVGSITIRRGSSGDITITVQKNGSFSDAVSFNASNLPTGVTASFNPPNSADTSVLTLNVAAGAPLVVNKAITVTGTGGGKSHTVSFTVTITNIPDTTKPTIVSTNPTNNQPGLFSNAKITVTFSEPMDQAATQAAFQSPDIGNVTFGWKDNGKTMVVTPSHTLAYSPNASRRYYHFSITTAAKDKAGNNLASGKSIRFSTLRTLYAYFKAQKSLDGYVWDHNGTTYSQLNYIRVGDQASGNRYARGFLSFEPNGYLAGKHIQFLKKAEVWVYQYKQRGNPYHDLAGFSNRRLLIYHVNYGSSLDNGDFDIVPVTSGYGKLSSSFTVGWRKINVTSWLADDYRHRRSRSNRSQYRLQFYKNTDGDNHDDHVEFYSANYANQSKVPVLKVWYYAP